MTTTEHIMMYIVLCMGVISICTMIYHTISFIEYKRRKNENAPIPLLTPLSFEECESILSIIIDDVYTNKYLVQYRLRDLTVIPKMDDEIKKITLDIISSMSDNLKRSFECYYTEGYLVSMITRKVQLLLIEYTNKHKPLVK